MEEFGVDRTSLTCAIQCSLTLPQNHIATISLVMSVSLSVRVKQAIAARRAYLNFVIRIFNKIWRHILTFVKMKNKIYIYIYQTPYMKYVSLLLRVSVLSLRYDMKPKK